MGKEKLVTIGIIVLILLVAGAIIYNKTVGLAIKDTPSEEVAKYIGEHAVVYVQAGCHACTEQEKLFGDNWKYINSVDCTSSQENTQICINLGIEGTPTWIINGQKYVGVQSIEKLKELTGYQE
ncbi:MAG: hypothetical protein PHH00_02235 [Candidatus Nanoarchaeia archaeon]|nr:hypothetical protein [Candidatus Nanoarchaeia archaeon]